MGFEVLRGFVGDEVAAGDIDIEGKRPFVIGDVTSRVARHENAGSDGYRIESTVGEDDLIQHGADAFALGDIRLQADGRSAA